MKNKINGSEFNKMLVSAMNDIDNNVDLSEMKEKYEKTYDTTFGKVDVSIDDKVVFVKC